MSKDDTLEYVTFVNEVQKNSKCEKGRNKKLDELFKNSNKDLVKLMKGMLEFNPYFRITAK